MSDANAESDHDPAMPPEAARYVAETERRAQAVDWSMFRVWRDTAYGAAPHQRLDVVAPKKTAGTPAPLVVYIHGGGWTHGSKDWMSFIAPAVTTLPAVFVSPNYGLAPDHLHPTPIQDCLSALAYLRRHAADYGADPDRIYLGGHSVGGHISSMIALRPELRARADLPDGAIRACIPVSGLFRVVDDDPTAAADHDEASPIHWAANAAMPFYVSYGENDYDRIKQENQEFIAALQHTGIALRIEALAGLDHYTANLGHADTEGTWFQAVAELIRETS